MCSWFTSILIDFSWIIAPSIWVLKNILLFFTSIIYPTYFFCSHFWKLYRWIIGSWDWGSNRLSVHFSIQSLFLFLYFLSYLPVVCLFPDFNTLNFQRLFPILWKLFFSWQSFYLPKSTDVSLDIFVCFLHCSFSLSNILDALS